MLGNGYRAYNPVLMRFNQPDSLSPFGQDGLNAYAYCQGDPVNRQDPSGRISGFKISSFSMFPEMSSYFDPLPNELLRQVVMHLPGEDIENLMRTFLL